MMTESPPSKPPPDLETLQYNAWDPEFSADMSSKMRVPDSIRVAGDAKEPSFGGMDSWGTLNGFGGGGRPDDVFTAFHPQDAMEQARDRARRSMTVPQRILVAGDDPHFKKDTNGFPPAAPLSPSSSSLASRHAAMELDFSAATSQREDSGVQLSTPPEVLTVTEAKFPTVYHDETPMAERRPRPGLPGGDNRSSPIFRRKPGGGGDAAPVFSSLQGSVNDVSNMSLGAITPMEDTGVVGSSLMSLQDETVLLRRHVAKLSRRVNQLEQDNLQRSYRDDVQFLRWRSLFEVSH